MKSAFKIGVITALMSSVVLFGLFSLIIWLKASNGWAIGAGSIRGVIGLLSIPILGIGIYIAMQNVKTATGKLTYGQAVATGLMVSFTVAVIIALFSFIYCKIINPGFSEYMVEDTLKTMFKNGGSQQDLNQGAEKVRAQFTPLAQVSQALAGQLVTGAILSVITGLFTRNKK